MNHRHTQNLLEIKNLVIEFKNGNRWKRAVDNISFTIKEGECLGLVGESGSGKSTIANAIMRFVPIRQGEILFRGCNLAGLKGKALRNMYQDIQMVFQNPEESLSPRMKIGRYVTEIFKNFQKPDRPTLRNKALELLNSVGLSEEYLDRFPAFLSGGERQRIAIARAVSIMPSLLICDEPTSALDVSVQALIVESLLKFQRQNGMTYLFISHDLPLVSHICQKVVIMYRGKIMEILAREDLAGQALHPYTQKLLSAAFFHDESLEAGSERPAAAEANSNGCVFRPDCSYAADICHKNNPELVEVGPDHFLACFKG